MNFSRCKKLIFEDLLRVQTQKTSSSFMQVIYIIRYLITNNSFKYCFWFRIGSWTKGKKKFLFLYFLAWIMHRHYTYKLGIQLPLGTLIDGGLSFNHFSCIIINGNTQIGKNCTIFQGVTIGIKIGEGVPKIGNNCVLGPGCKILGKVTIGDNVFIGANAVVTHDIETECVAVGIPANVVNKKGKYNTDLVIKHK